MSQPQITVLENGLTVVTQHVAARQVAIDLAVKAGARHETKQEKGAAHFLEHMLLDESHNHSLDSSNEKTRAMYGAYNGSTDYEAVRFQRQCRAGFEGEALELMADLLLHPKMDAQHFENERQSILREWDMDGSDEVSPYEAVQKIAFPASGLEKAIDGSKGQIKRLQPEQLQHFKNKHFTGPNMVLTVVGDVQHEEVVAMARRQFAELPAKAAETAQAERPANWRGGIFFEDMEESASTSISMGFEAAGNNDPANQYKDQLIAELLVDSGTSGQLMDELRHRMGAVYSASAYNSPFKDNAILAIETQCDVERGSEVMAAICKTLAALPASLTQEQLDNAKASLIGGLERAEPMRSEDICDSISSDMVAYGRPVSLDEQITAIEALTLDDIKSRAEQVFGSAPSVCVATDFEHAFPDYAEITAMLGKERQVDASGYAIAEHMPSADRSAGTAEVTAAPARAMQQGRGR
jgi:predicted Zn-dependent peptidase